MTDCSEMCMAAVSMSSCAVTYPAQGLDATRNPLLSFFNGLSEDRSTEGGCKVRG
jgi:hypothetical protein